MKLTSRALEARSRLPEQVAAGSEARALTQPPGRSPRPAEGCRRIRHSLRYGGPWFSAASGLPLEGGLGSPRRLTRVLLEGLRRPRRIAALIVLTAGTRSVRVYLSDSCAGRALRTYFDQRFLGVFPQNRLCRGVLLLPAQHENYVRGHRRQALRTNLRKAARAGLRFEIAAQPSAAFAAAEKVVVARRAVSTAADLRGLKQTWRDLFPRPEMTLLIARDPSGRPLAVIAAVIDEAVCLVEVALACEHEARWALHDKLVQLLIRRGVCYLLVEGDGPFGALGFDPDVHHFQHLLGYQLRHLIPRDRSRSPQRQRVGASGKV